VKRNARLGLAAGAVLLVLLGGALALYEISRARCFSLTGRAVCRVETSAPMVALTFDDGPTPLGVAAILPELARHDAHATFFLIGGEAGRRPDLVRAIAAAGHEIGDHSFSHVRMVGRTSRFYDREIELTQATLRSAGVDAVLFRPPHGKKLIGLPLAVERHGLKMILWDVEDPVTGDPRVFADQMVRAAKPGSILLVHAMYGSNGVARAALPAILDGLREKRLKVVTVSELLAHRAR
jgi:peptidoglycan/xylan/chitin deacetylase (PgdA/CDA1 family)